MTEKNKEIISKIKNIITNLSKVYGPPIWKPRLKPMDELIFTVLTQNTSDLNAEKAFLKLKTLGSWEEILKTSDIKIAKLIKSGGMSNIKSKRILGILQEIKKRENKLDISFLSKLSLDDARRWLTSIKGIGPKTASVLLSFSFNMPAIPVDTHIHRVSKRLNLITKKTSTEDAHYILEKLVEDKNKYSFHVLLINHGRKKCHSRNPKCEECSLKKICHYKKL
tara:strand:- start:675 stop:1343 length:669 start_codon:yes stop_codon:yes gene_type:complete